jgi:hypothetical protein
MAIIINLRTFINDEKNGTPDNQGISQRSGCSAEKNGTLCGV